MGLYLGPLSLTQLSVSSSLVARRYRQQDGECGDGGVRVRSSVGRGFARSLLSLAYLVRRRQKQVFGALPDSGGDDDV